MARPKRPTAAERRTIYAFTRGLEAHRDEWVGSITSTKGEKLIRLELTIPTSVLAAVLNTSRG